MHSKYSKLWTSNSAVWFKQKGENCYKFKHTYRRIHYLHWKTPLLKISRKRVNNFKHCIILFTVVNIRIV